MKNRKMSHELQQLYLLNQRTHLDEKTKTRYQNLYRGYLGEIHMDKLVETFCDGLEYLNDLTLVFKETMVQIDKIILVNHTVFLIDMKYYRGHYRFQNNNWYKDDKILLTNILEQLRKAKRLLQNIFNTHQFPLKVEGVLAFMNPDASIEIKDEVPEKILLYQDIPNWLYELKNMQESNTRLHWQRTLLQYTVAPFRTKKDYPIENINQLKKGICCRSCHSFQTVETKHSIICSCGHHEPKKRAYARTVCEFGTLFHKRGLKKKQLKEFFGDNVNQRYLSYILNKYFPIEKKAGHMSTHKNKGVLFDYWFENEMDYFDSLEKRKNWR